ncbi:MAG TPA: Gfo/Idh/MocA family oxidoreductase [Methylomirabilota bacterium]|nr:Gfo/Idh/MocA family oxidoreductase [Methylomirabilota bacterium]
MTQPVFPTSASSLFTSSSRPHAHRRRHWSRRRFLKTGATAALTAASWKRVLGANERVGVGIIGFGLIGRIHTRSFLEQPDVNLVGVAETYQPRLDAAAELVGPRMVKYRDFRRLLENKDVEAVVVATPDHWHALMTMMACAAGKDVYVEKPLTLFVREGRWMIDVARRYRRVVQVGTQNRSGPNFQRARALIQEGKLGNLVSAQNQYFRNVMPGFGRPPDGDPPPELDWNLWLGPAPYRRYNPNRAIYHFRWFWDYSGGQMTNLGQHSLDLVHWFSGATAPRSVYSTGGRFHLQDNCEVPDTQDAIHEYPGFTLLTQYREASAGVGGLGMGGLVFNGTRGSIAVGRSGFEVFPDPKVNPINTVAAIIGGHPVGGPQPVPEEKGQFWTEKIKDESGDAPGDYRRHARDFLACIKSRKPPLSDLEGAHQVATACHLANISLKTGRKITWDAAAETIVNDREAVAMLERPYRAPWDAELKALGVRTS